MSGAPKWMKEAVALGHYAFIDAAPLEHVPYAAYVDERTLITRDGTLIQTLELDGVPFDTASRDDLESWKQARALVLKQISHPAITVTWNAIRRQETRLPGGRFESGWARDLNDRYMQTWAGRRFYSNTFYLTVARAAPAVALGLLERIGARTARASTAAQDRAIESLTQVVDNLRSSFSRYRPKLLTLNRSDRGLEAEHLSPLGWLVNAAWRELVAPTSGLARAICWNGLRFSGDTVQIRHADGSVRYGAMLGLREYPPTTGPGMLDALLEIDAEITLTQSYQFASRDSAIEEARQQARRYELMGDAAITLKKQLDEMTDDLASRKLEWGQHHLSILVLADSQEELTERINSALTVLNSTGASGVRETLNLEPAWWAQLPGNARYIARKGGITTRNLAGFASMHDFDAGKLHGNRWGTALTVLETLSRTPYWFSFHVGDKGHTAVVGPTGSGKTVAMCFLLAQAQRYPERPRIFCIDKDRSTEITVRALGGAYTVIRPGVPTGWNPFQLEDTPGDRAWLKEFLAFLAKPDGRAHPQIRAQIDFAVKDLFGAPENLRNAAGFLSYINLTEIHQEARENLRAWLHPEGDRFWVFGADTNTFDLKDAIAGFDLTALMTIPDVCEASMSWIFHRISKAVDGTPTIVYVEEAWSFLRHPLFKERLLDWIRTWRKKNAIVLFVTQGAEDALQNGGGRTLIENTATQIIFPSSKISRKQYVEEWKLTDHQYDLLTTLGSDSRAFLVRRGDDTTILRLDLTRFQNDLMILSSTAERLEVLDTIRARVGDDPNDWMPLYLELAT